MYKWNDRIDYESIDQLKAEINYYFFFWLQPLIQHSVFPLELFCDLIICDSPDESKMAVSQANNRGRAGGRWRSGGGAATIISFCISMKKAREKNSTSGNQIEYFLHGNCRQLH